MVASTATGGIDALYYGNSQDLCETNTGDYGNKENPERRLNTEEKNMTQSSTGNWSLVCHLNYGETGKLAIVRHDGSRATVTPIEAGPNSGADLAKKPIFLGIGPKDGTLLLDPVTKEISVASAMPLDAIPAYAYPDAGNDRIWFMNDGDKETGTDSLNCGTAGSSVTIVDQSGSAKLLKTLCVGRGHHVTTFVTPAASGADVKSLAFVSNLMDGTVSVVGNNATDEKTFLNVVDTINLCETDKEDGGEAVIPNSAFPHGMVYSPATGKLYNLNNGYGTIAVIDPLSREIETRIPLPVSSNLLLSPNGRFIIGKGADRKTDPNHVRGRLSVVALASNEVATTLDLEDFYPSTYRFSAGGNKLYVTSAATGKGQQRENLKTRSVLVYDTSALPALSLIKEIEVGAANCSRRPIALTVQSAGAGFVFIPNPSDGTLSILDSASDEVLDTVVIGEDNSKEVLFSFWDGSVSGC